jgi:hypothetical protein
MVDPVGAALACVGLLDPVYTRIRIVLKAYETTTRFGKDFNNSYSQLHMEEWSFKGSLDKYGCYLDMLQKSGREFDREQPVLRRDIETQVTSMVYVFNDCYSIVKKYDTQST